MTTQQAYEMMRIYLTRPGARQASLDGGACSYETEMFGEVHRCAIGCILSPAGLAETVMIDDELHEDHGLTHVLRDFEGGLGDLYCAGFKIEELLGVDHGFLQGAQCLHDDESNWREGKFRVALLDGLAIRHGLLPVKDGVPEEEPVMA